MDSNVTCDCDIAIVGAGPVGMLTALLLHQLDIRVQILERRNERWNLPRAVTCYSQTLRILQGLGLLDEVLATKAIFPFRPQLADHCEWIGADGTLTARIPFNGPSSRSGMDVVYGMDQMAFDALLERACAIRGIPVRRGTDVVAVTDHGDHVSILWQPYISKNKEQHAPSSTPTPQTTHHHHHHDPLPKHETTALFVVGADGARSAVRSSAGIDFLVRTRQRRRWLVLDVSPRVPDDGGGPSPHTWRDEGFFRQYNDPARPCTSAPSLGFRRRLEFMLLPGEGDGAAWDDGFVWGLLRGWGVEREQARLARQTVFSPLGGWCARFASGRVVLVGDAAHCTPQFLGAGLNTGVRDAKAVAWRLAAAVRCARAGVDWRRLLEDYSREQHGIAEMLVSLALEVEELIAVTDPEEAKRRDERLKQEKIAEGYPDVEALGLDGMYLRDGERVDAGRDTGGVLFMLDEVVYRGRRGPFDVVAGQGWVLLGAGPENPVELLGTETRKRFDELFEGSAFWLGGKDGIQDLSGRYTEWFASNKALAVLVRPDFYIYAIASAKHEVDTIVRSALEHVFPKLPEPRANEGSGNFGVTELEAQRILTDIRT